MANDDFTGGRRPVDPNTPPRRPEMSDTLLNMRLAEDEAREFDTRGTGGRTRPSDQPRGAPRAVGEAAEIPGVKSRNSEQPTKPVVRPKLEDPIEARIETHRASISSHEKAIYALATRRDVDSRRLQGELAELTRSFEETRELYIRSINGIGNEINDQIAKHRRLVESDRVAMDSLLGRSRAMIGGEAPTADTVEREAYIERKVEEGVKKALEAAWPTPAAKRMPISRAKAHKAVAAYVGKGPPSKAKIAAAGKTSPADRKASTKAARAINGSATRGYVADAVAAATKEVAKRMPDLVDRAIRTNKQRRG